MRVTRFHGAGVVAEAGSSPRSAGEEEARREGTKADGSGVGGSETSLSPGQGLRVSTEQRCGGGGELP